MADHANNLASKIRNNLTNSMKALGVDILTGVGTILVCSIAIWICLSGHSIFQSATESLLSVTMVMETSRVFTI